MRQKAWLVLKDLYDHKFTYILRATLLQLLISIFGAWLLSALFQAVLVSTDLPGLTTDNIGTFLSSPLTLFLLLVYLFALAFLVYFEFSILVEMLRYKEARLQLTVARFKTDCRNFFKSLSSWHILAFLAYLVLTIPFLSVLFSSTLVENLYIPKFISGELTKSSTGSFLYYGLYAVLAYVNYRLIYTLPLTVTGAGRRFGHNMAESWRLTKGRQGLKLLGLVLVALGLFVLLSLLTAAGIGLASLFDQGFDNVTIQIIFLSFVWGVNFAGHLLFKLSALSYLLLVLGREKAEPLPNVSPQRKQRRIWTLVLLLLVIGGVNYLYQSSNLAGTKTQKIQSLAHRGYVSQGVENSLEALEAASKQGVTYVEMDVILSKDQQFIVSHDDNLKRLTGKDINISQSNASQVLGLTTRQNGFKSQLVSFETYVAKAKELGVKLLVELKPTGAEPDNYEELFVTKMKELGVEEDYMVMSLDLNVIEKVEQLNPKLETGYTISLQFGDFTSQKVDFYAIEDFSYKSYLAKSAHDKGKKIYVWTINSTDDLTHYLQTSVDGIITDYPNLLKQERNAILKDNSYLDYFLRVMGFSA